MTWSEIYSNALTKEKVEIVVMSAGKATDMTEAVYMEEVAIGEEEVVAIRISPTRPGMVLISSILICISAVLIGMPVRGMVEHVLAVNETVEGLTEDAVTTDHVEDVATVEGDRFHKLILIGLTPAVEYVATEDMVYRTVLALEDERTESYAVSHCSYVVYLNDDHDTTLQ